MSHAPDHQQRDRLHKQTERRVQALPDWQVLDMPAETRDRNTESMGGAVDEAHIDKAQERQDASCLVVESPCNTGREQTAHGVASLLCMKDEADCKSEMVKGTEKVHKENDDLYDAYWADASDAKLMDMDKGNAKVIEIGECFEFYTLLNGGQSSMLLIRYVFHSFG